VDNRAVIHQPHQRAKTYEYRNGRLIPRSSDRELERDALAHLLWADATYQRGLYHLPPTHDASISPSSMQGAGAAL
jgi:hypothetical protein